MLPFVYLNHIAKRYVRTLLYSLLTLFGTLALYLSVNWVSEKNSNIATPFEAINSYLTAIPTEETAFDNDNDSESVLTAEETFHSDVSEITMEDEYLNEN